MPKVKVIELVQSEVQKVKKPGVQMLLTVEGGKIQQVKQHIAIQKNEYLDFPEVKQTSKRDWPECECDCDEECGDQCELYKLDIECHLRAHGKVDCGNQRLQRKQYAKSQVKEAGGKGRGLFALEEIQSNQLVIEYIGQVINQQRCTERLTEKHFYMMRLANNKYVDASIKGNNSRFINHSCDPNCETRYVYVGDEKRIGIFATRKIAANEEITYDYMFEDWSNEPMRCCCGSNNCTGFMDKSHQTPSETIMQ